MTCADKKQDQPRPESCWCLEACSGVLLGVVTVVQAREALGFGRGCLGGRQNKAPQTAENSLWAVGAWGRG